MWWRISNCSSISSSSVSSNISSSSSCCCSRFSTSLSACIKRCDDAAAAAADDDDDDDDEPRYQTYAYCSSLYMHLPRTETGDHISCVNYLGTQLPPGQLSLASLGGR